MKATKLWHRLSGPQFLPEEAHSGFAQLPSYTPEYMTVGEGQSIVLVPGLAGGYGLLGRLAGLLAKDFHVVTYELRGEREPLPTGTDLSLEALATDLGHLLDYLQLERPVVLGVSFGTAVALEFAISQAGRVGSLVLQGADTRFRASLVNSVGKELLSRVPLPHDSPFVNQFFRLFFSRMEQPGTLVDFVTRRCWGTDQGVMVRRLAMLETIDFEDRLDAIQVPTLVMAAEHDLFASAVGQRTLAERIPDAELVTIPKAGHLAFLTKPKTVARLTREFHQWARVVQP